MTDTRECLNCQADISHRQANAIYCDDKCREQYRWPRRADRQVPVAHQPVYSKPTRDRPMISLGRFVSPDQVRGGTAMGGGKGGYEEQIGGLL